MLMPSMFQQQAFLQNLQGRRLVVHWLYFHKVQRNLCQLVGTLFICCLSSLCKCQLVFRFVPGFCYHVSSSSVKIVALLRLLQEKFHVVA